MLLLLGSDVKYLLAKLRIMDAFGMLAVTHGMLRFADIAVAQNI